MISRKGIFVAVLNPTVFWNTGEVASIELSLLWVKEIHLFYLKIWFRMQGCKSHILFSILAYILFQMGALVLLKIMLIVSMFLHVSPQKFVTYPYERYVPKNWRIKKRVLLFSKSNFPQWTIEDRQQYQMECLTWCVIIEQQRYYPIAALWPVGHFY